MKNLKRRRREKRLNFGEFNVSLFNHGYRLKIMSRSSFQTALSLDPTLKPHIMKAQDDLSPLSIMRLLESVSDEV